MEKRCKICGRTDEEIRSGLRGIHVCGELVGECHRCGNYFCSTCAPYIYWTFYGSPEKVSTCPECRVPIPKKGWDGGPPLS